MKVAEFKDRLRQAMEMRDLKQIDLANRGNFDKGQLSSWLSGKYKPKQENTDKLADILGVSEGWLLGYDTPMERGVQMHLADVIDDPVLLEGKNAPLPPTIHDIQLSDVELDLVEKYRFLDDHGKDMVTSVLDKEYDRCQDEEENSVTIDRDMALNLPLELRLKFGGVLEEGDQLMVARRKKK